MLRSLLRSWAGWAPGLESREALAGWARDPSPLAVEGHPAAGFLPPLLRRRCTPLSRVVLTSAFACCPEEDLPRVRTVFASRHGSINESIGLLDAIVRGQRISPARFSHTVHNAQAGLFSIAAGNRMASSSLSAQEDTFACGFLEALAHLERDPVTPVLYVMGDVPLSPTFAPLVNEPQGVYGLALLLAAQGEGTPLGFALDAGDLPSAAPPWPDALEFVRWLVCDDTPLRLGRSVRRFRWTKLG